MGGTALGPGGAHCTLRGVRPRSRRASRRPYRRYRRPYRESRRPYIEGPGSYMEPYRAIWPSRTPGTPLLPALYRTVPSLLGLR